MRNLPRKQRPNAEIATRLRGADGIKDDRLGETVNGSGTRGSWSLLACEGVQDASNCRRRVRRAGNPDEPSNPGDRGGRGPDPRSRRWGQPLRLEGRRRVSKGREGAPLPPDTGLRCGGRGRAGKGRRDVV